MATHRRWEAIASCAVMLLFVGRELRAEPPASSEPELIAAARRGDVAAMERVFLQGQDLNQVGPGRQTAMHAAATAAQDKAVAWLISHEANVFAKDDSGKVPADITTELGHRSTSTVLKKFMLLLTLEQQASKDEAWEDLDEILTRDSRAYTILHVLAIRGNVEEARRRIQAGALVNAKTVLGITPLMKAAVLGHADMVALLLKSGADVNARDLLDNTPLIAAVVSGKQEVVKMILDAGADLKVHSRKTGGTALELAEKLGRDQIAVMLRQAGAGK